MPDAQSGQTKGPFRWIRALYDWTVALAASRHAGWALFAVAFTESSFFPIPPDVLLIPMVLAEKRKWIWHATICSLGSILGGLFGYLIGWQFFELIGKPIVNFYHLEQMVAMIGAKYEEHAFFTVFTAAFTPVPYKLITIAAGLFKISISTLVVASLLGRAGRFFLVAAALRIFGEKIRNTIEKNFNLFSIVFMVLLVGGFLLLKFVLK